MSNQRFVLQKSDSHPVEARLVSITKSRYDGDWHSILHTHSFAEVFYVLSGNGRFLVDGDAFEVKENDFVIVNPHVKHTETSWLSSPLKYVVLGIDGIHFHFHAGDKTEEHTPQNNYRLFNYRDQRNKLQVYLKVMLDEVEAQQPYYHTVCQNLLEVLLVDILRQANFSFSVVAAKQVNTASNAAKGYIDAHFKETITLDKLSQHAHVNKYYLTHLFTKDYGMSPITYIASKRVEECKNLLENTDLSMGDIASIVGFSSQSYFSQMFKKMTGVSPAQYRAQMKENRRL